MRRLVLAIGLLGCGPSRTEAPRADSKDYEAPALWACRPDLPDDACRVDLTATELHADGSRTVVKHTPALAPAIDCFYVYPTVDLRLRAGNHADLSDVDEVKRTVKAQIARFTEVCQVYAPLYRQATIGTYLGSQEDKDRFFGVAYSDVAAAFDYYRRVHNKGRRVVLVGHSQGAQMIGRLLADTFDKDAALRPQLVAALPIGFYFDVQKGATTGGSFQSVPVCTSDAENGCIVAYRTLAAGDTPAPDYWPLAPGRTAICVDPAGVNKGPTTFSRAFFPTDRVRDVKGVDTPFVLLRDFYRGECVHDPGGRDFLSVAEQRATTDARPSVVDLTKHRGFIGLHTFDFQFTQGDLIDLVRKKTASP